MARRGRSPFGWGDVVQNPFKPLLASLPGTAWSAEVEGVQCQGGRLRGRELILGRAWVFPPPKRHAEPAGRRRIPQLSRKRFQVKSFVLFACACLSGPPGGLGCKRSRVQISAARPNPSNTYEATPLSQLQNWVQAGSKLDPNPYGPKTRMDCLLA
jgi:hypothetical protein